ncbi:hypothetical protein [Pseudomonas sp. 18058]|uniref:hypothetical protein n=1 Tax=Pseudomonas sp. 18058 TaxID=2681406 RepID=UPI00135829AE|nr:hypothetical protein [Pseudomonas sp. 18058]
MKRTILTVIALAALSITAVQAQQTIPVSPTPQPGAPGTATPTPYPQITPINIPKSGAGSGSPPLVPIEMPTPPNKDQPVPGIEPSGSRAKSPGG